MMPTLPLLRRTLCCLPLLLTPLLATTGCGGMSNGNTDVHATDATDATNTGDVRTDVTSQGDVRTDATGSTDAGGGSDVRTDTGGSRDVITTADGCVSTPEADDTACADGIDNDCDGHTDCNDFDCSRNTAVTVCATDGGATRDTGACTPTGTEDTNAACGDGLDNDCDGFTDCSDFNCSRNAAVTVCPTDGGTTRDTGPCTPTGTEDTNAACTDGIDNDCDGFIDCNDFNCSRNSAVTVCPTDGGTRRDSGPCTPTGTEDTNAACTDGIDNDCDGFIDCNDFNCSRNSAVTVCPTDGGTRTDASSRRDVGSCVPTGTEDNDTVCADGIDNDCDGFVDCVDFGCSRNAAVTICPGDAG